ncbi:MAG: hypothetical protein JO246_08920, partial [Frankiaceae bacterium]|nr:hypothetical protein [Frankiaceae bacterium]
MSAGGLNQPRESPMSMNPEPRPLLRGYGPLACLLVAFALMAAFVPTDAPERVVVAKRDVVTTTGGTAGGNTTPSGSTGPGGQSGGNGSSTTTTTGGSGVATSDNTSGDQAQPVAHSKGCSGPQVQGDSYSPPCVKFSGNNGGATTRGVTGSTITVSYRQTSDPGFQQTLASIGGAQFNDTPADIKRTILGLQDYFNKNFQFYGRKIHFVFYKGQGTQTNELLGGGQAQAGDDALHVATSIKAFADMSSVTEPYGDALTRQKVMNFGEPYLSANWFQSRAPYAWSLA